MKYLPKRPISVGKLGSSLSLFNRTKPKGFWMSSQLRLGEASSREISPAPNNKTLPALNQVKSLLRSLSLKVSDRLPSFLVKKSMASVMGRKSSVTLQITSSKSSMSAFNRSCFSWEMFSNTQQIKA